MKKILLVEDDQRLGNLMTKFLKSEGLDITWLERGDLAVGHILEHHPDLVVLDFMLPGMDGIEVCKAVRSGYRGPILMLTAMDDDLTEVTALNSGFDDFITKPFRSNVLLARIQSLLRRIGSVEQPAAQDLCYGELRVSLSTREVHLGETLLNLTDAEFELLVFLANHAGTIISREDIYLKLRGIEYDGIDRSMDMRVSSLRKKLNDNGPTYRFIKTVRSQGYLFVQK